MTEVHRYRRFLDRLPEEPPCPEGFRGVAFDPERHARAVHQLLEDGYRQGGGSVPEFESWRVGLLSDEEYDPTLVFLLADEGGSLVGTAVCWTSGFVKDLAVAAGARQRGLGAVLLGRAFAAFRARGAGAVDLKVHADNLGAVALYRSVGMRRVEL